LQTTGTTEGKSRGVLLDARLRAERGDLAGAASVLAQDPTGDRQILLRLGDLLAEQGNYTQALDSYRRVLATCHENGVAPAVTFHHFTTPRWVVARGGWIEPATAVANSQRKNSPPSPSPGTTAPPLVVETLQALRWRFWKPILATGVAVLLASAPLALLLQNYTSGSLASPLSTFRLLNQAGNDGDGDRWSNLIR
jgi:tetratricopeptide (TPR) repeat protein